MCTFVTSETMIGGSLALQERPTGLTYSQVEMIISHLYRSRPDINAMLSRDDIEEMLFIFNDLIIKSKDRYILYGESIEDKKISQEKARTIFLKGISDSISRILVEAVKSIE